MMNIYRLYFIDSTLIIPTADDTIILSAYFSVIIFRALF